MYYADPPRVMVTGEWMEEPLPARLVARWNGWAVPAFARAEAEAVVRQQAQLADPDVPSLWWEGDSIVCTDPSDPDYREVVQAEPIDGVPRWELGLGWTWETLDFEDPAVPTAPQRAAFDALREGLAEGESVYSATGTVEADGSHTFRVQRAAAEQPDPRYTRTETARTVRIDREGRTVVSDPIGALRAEREWLWEALQAQGGRGVDLAERIDEIDRALEDS